MSEDALSLRSRMNLREGGKQPKLRSTTLKNKRGEVVEQKMQHPSGEQKGLATVG